MSAVPLSELLSAPREADAPVAWHRDGVHTWRDFGEHVEGLALALQQGGGTNYLLDCTNSFAFAVGLFGIARAGGVAWLPPNRQAGTLKDLLAACDGAVGDEAPGDGEQLHPLESRAPVEAAVLDPDRAVLRLFTSGTTGQAKEIPKSWRQLDEVAELERRFGGPYPEGTRVFATAPHYHLYGLLFRVLWPLAAGRSFQSESLLHAEELQPRMADGGPAILASTPAHLRRWIQRQELSKLRGQLVEVFSSGGPLPAETAAGVEAALGVAPIEIFGSTETGGVAERRQSAASSAPSWQTIGGVEVRRDDETGCLRVRSPYVSVGALQPDGQLEFEMGDRVEIEDGGRFALRGRADRIVKIGEKRLSLPDMESQLLSHPYVSEAALVDVERGGEARVAAILVLSAQGLEAEVELGRRQLGTHLSEALAPHWDRVLLPRAWRFVDAMPRDERGKLPRKALLEVVGDRPTEPTVLSETLGPERLEVELQIPKELAQVEGHFPGWPVVPGVVQLGWVLETAERLLGFKVRARGVEVLKFKEALLPGTRVSLEVLWTEADREKSRIRFRVTQQERELASGRIEVEAP